MVSCKELAVLIYDRLPEQKFRSVVLKICSIYMHNVDQGQLRILIVRHLKKTCHFLKKNLR